MEKITANTDLIRSHVITIILRSLQNEDKYGYEICREIETLSQGTYILKQPTLYSCLKRLESQEYISSYWGEESNGGRRKYYSLTQKGREFLEKDQEEWEFSRTLMNKLLSDKEFDLSTAPPFDASELRPNTKQLLENEAEIAENSAQNSVSDQVQEEKSISVNEQVEQKIEEKPVELSPVFEKNDETIAQKDNVSVGNAAIFEKDNVQSETAAKNDVEVKESAANNYFEAPTSDVNYKNVFSDLLKKSESTEKESEKVEDYSGYKSSKTAKKEQNDDAYFSEKPKSINELQSVFYADGYKLRPYSKSNANSYYTSGFYYSNKLSMFAYWLLYFLIVFELGFCYFFLNNAIDFEPSKYVIFILIGLLIPVIPTVRYVIEPRKREKAQFDLKLSIINRLMLFLNLVLVVACVGFFIFKADIQNVSSLVKPVIFPIVMLLNIPISSFIYYLLFNSKRFFVS